jgi:hypothetical protein|tara:strand:- start:14498 stop:26665 length:12168 start_codon:yes stop_codon:yes gene_type:complete
MSENRIQFSTIVESQLPAYVREDYPLVSEFLKQYYIGQEYQGGPVDLIQNIDKYIKLSNTTNLNEGVVLGEDITFYDTTITVDSGKSPRGTKGFPDSYGLLKIEDEVITYTGKTDFSFTGCRRGFVGITSYRNNINDEEVLFESNSAEAHTSGENIQNLSCLFLKEFLLKTKNQLLPGLENRTLDSNLNQNLFIKQSKDFYISKGTDTSFKILFKALYNKDVSVLKPSENLFTPSNSSYRVLNELVVEPIVGNPENLKTATLYQDEYKFDSTIKKAYAPITSVEKIEVGYGKTFYRLGFDGGYNRDTRVDGTLYGQFTVEPSTKIIGSVSAGSTIIDVDSTVGFSTSGELHLTYSGTAIDDRTGQVLQTSTVGVVSYTSKSLTQFFGVTNLTATVPDATTVGINTFAYGRSIVNPDEIIKVRISSVLDKLNLPENTTGLKKGTTANVTTLGCKENNFKTNKWFYNVAPTYKVSKVELIDASDFTYKITLKVKNYLKVGNAVEIILNDDKKLSSNVVSIINENSFYVRGQGSLNVDSVSKVRRKIQKGSSNTFPNIKEFSTDVDALYKNKDNEYLIATPSLPTYDSQPIEVTPRQFIFSGTFSGTEFKISPGVDHGFYTGDAIRYTARSIEQSFVNSVGSVAKRIVRDTGLFDDGLYFVQRVDAFTLKFAKSRTDIYNSEFVSVDTETTVTNSLIEPFEFYTKTLKPQKLLKKIPSPTKSGKVTETKPGFTGILVNGVEILNYKAKDFISYGAIESVDILSPGNNVDIINTPNLLISDSVGTGATGYISVSGSLREVRIKDSGFDYLSTPKVKITGGNGQGAICSVDMKRIDHAPEFFADEDSQKVSIGTTSIESRIGFSTFHKFRNAEQVIYKTRDQKAVAGIVTNASYFVSTINNTTVRLHKTQADAIAGINTVFLTDYGVGKHSLQSVNKKLVVNAINVVNGGSGYENKKRTSPAATGINTASNTIIISNHGYSTGELIKYSCVGTPVSGLTVDSEYYITTIDKDSFKLSSVGVSSDKQFLYRTKQYINLESTGVGTHVFNYPDISFTLAGEVGISSIGLETFKAEVEPIFRGSVTSVNIENGGIGYGSSEILNYDRQPKITIDKGKNAQVKPIINDGKIINVIVLNSGSNYTSTPDILLNGDGIGAVLVPIMENGSLTEVKVIESGVGYLDESTVITILDPGENDDAPVFNSKLKTWNVNLFEKNSTYFAKDDGVIVSGTNELQYSHLYAPRVFRQSNFAIDQVGNIQYGESDLRRVNSIEVNSLKHSPILGFAYDGNPIYGPYGYSSKTGGTVASMKSGYSLDIKSNRPPTSIFPEGFFIEDYTHNHVNDESVLDENNGRFCITPDYPNGVYAYFMTINDSFAELSGTFEKYKKPVFPYIIGHNYYSDPDEFNFTGSSTQDSFEFRGSDLRRNTEPLNLIEEDSEYPYIYIPNKLNQTINISATTPGTITGVGIVTSGDNYKVGEKLVFNNDGTGGDSAYAKISKVKGKPVNRISVATSSIENVEIYPGKKLGEYEIYCDNPHQFSNSDVVSISGISTTGTGIDGSYLAGISTNTFTIAGVGTTAVAIGTDGITGLVTFFNLIGDLSFSNIRENDILLAGTERVKVLNVDKLTSRIRVLRAVDGTVSTAHTIGKFIREVPRKLKINVGYKTDYSFRINEQVYFNPVETVGLGTTSGIGIGITLSFSNPGAGITQKFIPTKSLYFRNHNFRTGDLVTYSPGSGGTGLYVENESNVGVGTTLIEGQQLFIAKISDDLIGIATVRVGLGTTGTFKGIASGVQNSSTLFIKGVGVGDTHSFTTNHNAITGTLNRNTVTVSLSTAHGLHSEHRVDVFVNPENSKTVTFKYDDYNRRILINPLDFTNTGVDTSNGNITLTDHGFLGGEKVIYTATDVSEGLTNESIYYVTRIDSNIIRLSESYHNTTLDDPITVGIASTGTSGGTISPINPPITLYKNSITTFDLSDSSLGYSKFGTDYAAFNLNLYTDKNFTQIWNTSSTTKTFEYSKSGKVGTSGGKTTLIVNDDIPENLYYRLDPVYDSELPETKSQIFIDDEVISANEITIKQSKYSGNYPITVGTNTSFTYTLAEKPEAVSYASTTNSIIKYETDCTHTSGPVAKIQILNPGKNYYSLPGITTVDETSGSGAVFEATSSTIGKLKSARLNDIGFNLPADTTLKPSVLFPQTVKINALNSFVSVGLGSFGRGFNLPPKLIVIDGSTKKLIDDAILKIVPGSETVEILQNTNRLTNVTPTIIPTLTDSGVGISTIVFDATTKEATATLSVGFSTVNIFPFAIGDKILVENVSVGVGSTGTGYNSSNYDYRLFDVTGVTTNLGGIGSVTFSMNGFYDDGELPGQYDTVNSAGRITAQKDFPVFDVILEPSSYFIGEEVKSNSATGIVEDWNPRLGILRISSNDNFIIDEEIVGQSSKSVGIATSTKSFESYVDFNSFSKVVKGSQTKSGFLNFDLQRVQDNFYYQKFSYSLKSEIPYDTWNDSVSTLNHTLGYKKFADYQLESTTDGNEMTVGVASDGLSVVNDINSFGSLHCVHDFDLATENSIGSPFFSDEIVFKNRILSDYFESIGNRVLSIDDFSGQFNSEPRANAFSIVETFDLTSIKAQKYITYVRDRRFTAQRQLMIVDLVHDGSSGYLNQYGRVESHYDQGSFDFSISGTEGQLLFYPTKFTVNDYDISTISYNLAGIATGIGTNTFGNVGKIETKSTAITSGSDATIVSIANTYTSLKAIVNITPDNTRTDLYELVELNVINDGSNIDLLEFGRLTADGVTAAASPGFGTYSAADDGTNLEITFHPGSSVAANGAINAMYVGLATHTSTGVSTTFMSKATLDVKTTSIASSGSPGFTTISEYENIDDGAYFIVQVTDTTNNRIQSSEVVVVDSFVDTSNAYDVYLTEYANLESSVGLGTIGALVDTSGKVSLTFTPLPSINIVTTVFKNTLRLDAGSDSYPGEIDFTNGSLVTELGSYTGTENDIKRSFGLTHETDAIFERYFVGNDPTIVDVSTNTIRIPNHFYVSGEEIKYDHVGTASSAIGIATDTFVGASNTTFLPKDNLFAVKIDDNLIKIATSAENALKSTPVVVDLESVGIGTSHRFVATNQNAKVIVAIDNVIQSPIVSTAVTTGISTNFSATSDTIEFSGITSFFGADLIKIGDEIMKIEGIGIGKTNAIRVRRAWMGTFAGIGATGDLVTKITGNYNIVNNDLNFVEAPFGNTPIGSVTNSPDERDWSGITSSSTFQGRSFMRSGIENESNSSYSKNYIFDNVSNDFTGTNNEFRLKQNGSDITGITEENAVILINDIFQIPGTQQNYTLNESSGISSVTFDGSLPQTPLGSDVGISSFPKGGVIISVGSTEGLGYQPLVSAGGTAIVSGLGTISSISIGNSGSGYRSGIQTVVNVGVGTSSLRTGNIEFIGTAAISNGHIVSVAITNPGSGYTATNQPFVVFDDPVSYSNMSLHYSSSSVSGVGSEAVVDVVVGQGSSVIDFEVINSGYGYGNGEILTVAIGGSTGIPTTSSYSGNEFQLTIDEVISDKFSGWSLGTLQILDSIDEFIDGFTREFPLKVGGQITSIVSSPGSKINVQDVLLVFVNDILQVPGVGYAFNGGSIITFSEAPKVNDVVKIVFYKGNGDSDVTFRNVIETVKKGDTLQLKHTSDSQESYLTEDERSVLSILSTGNVETNAYHGPGKTEDVTLERPVTWCRQTEDKIINKIPTGKDRELYEPVINPSAYITKSVGIGSTTIYVDNLRPIFDSRNESTTLTFQKKIKFIKQEQKIGAAATAVVSGLGTISSVVISNGGVGYSTATVSFGYTSSSRAFGSVTISAGGTVTGVAITSAGVGYTNTNPPTVLISPPAYNEEEVTVGNYYGDNGVIVGFGSTSVGIGTTQLIFDIHIPYDSFLRNSNITGTAVTATGIQANDYFVIKKSNVGLGSTSITSFDSSGSVVGVGTSFADNVYQVASVEGLTTSVSGISTHVKRLFVNVDGFASGFSGITTSDFMGQFSWGKIEVVGRSKATAYNAYTESGIGLTEGSGITTSAMVVRSNFLKFTNYVL